MIELIKKTNIDFMGARKYAFTVSGILILLGIIGIAQMVRGKANLGIDFAGGTAVQVKFTENVKLDSVRAALEESGLRDFDLQDLPTENKVLIRVKKSEEKLGGFSKKIIGTLSEKFSAQKPVIDSTMEIGPKVGGKLRNDALLAIIASGIGILFYIAIRFEFRFGVGATIATAHDVLALIGIFFVLGKETNLIFVSALLMIAGYSLTDTVVVYDRIRENLRARYKGDIKIIINLSVNEVLSRTVIVSFTTFLTAISLFLFGGEVIHDFSLAIVLGIIIGTYSSVFIASPALLMWGGRKPLAKK